MAFNKLTMGRASVGALTIGSTSGNPSRGVNGAGGVPTIAYPANMSPTTMYLKRRTFVDMSASGLWAASVATAVSAIQAIPVVGINIGDDVQIQPLIAPLSGIGYQDYVANAFDLTHWSASQTGLVIGAVQAAQTVPNYTRTSGITLVSGSCIVLDTAAADSDLGAHMTGTGIPANTTIEHVEVGVGYILNRAATALASGTYTFGVWSAFVIIAGSTTGASAPTWANASQPGQTIADSGATPVTWLNLGTGCAAMQWTNSTGSTITTGTGLLGAYEVIHTGFTK